MLFFIVSVFYFLIRCIIMPFESDMHVAPNSEAVHKKTKKTVK